MFSWPWTYINLVKTNVKAKIIIKTISMFDNIQEHGFEEINKKLKFAGNSNKKQKM